MRFLLPHLWQIPAPHPTGQGTSYTHVVRDPAGDVHIPARDDEAGAEVGLAHRIQTPWQGEGGSCHLVCAHGLRYLFTGTLLVRRADGRWCAPCLGAHASPRDRADVARSLEMLRDLAPDVAVSGRDGGGEAFEQLAPGAWAQRVDAALDAFLGVVPA